jgi:adenylate kinase family enzyme
VSENGGAEARPTRICVHGASGSGKTTLATALADRLGVPRVELDGIFHQPGWTRLATDEFRAAVSRVVEGPGWVVDGNYREVRDLVWARAEVIVVIDLPRWRVMRQIVRRSVIRAAARSELWNGNRESFRNLFSTDAERNVVLWSWRTHHRSHGAIQAEARAESPQARLVVLSDRNAADAFPDRLAHGAF